MKRILLIILFLGVVISGVMMFREWKTVKKPTAKPLPQTISAPLEAVLPADPVLYLKITDFSRLIDTLGSTQAWQRLGDIHLADFMLKLGVPPDDVKSLDRWREILQETIPIELLKKLIGKEFAVGLYLKDFKYFRPEEVGPFLSSFYFVTRLSPDLRIAESSGALEAVFGNKASMSSLEYQGQTIHIAKMEKGLRICYTVIKDLLVFGIKRDFACRSAIKVMKNFQDSLYTDKQFLLANSTYMDKSNVQGFINWQVFIKTVKERTVEFALDQGADPLTIREKVDANMKQAAAFQLISFSGTVGKTTHIKSTVAYNLAMLPEQARQVYQCTPQDNKTLQFIPATVLGYQWSPCYDFNKYWAGTKGKLFQSIAKTGSATPPEQVLANVDQSLGVSIENEILPLMGREFGGALLDVDSSKLLTEQKDQNSLMPNFPRIQMFLFLQVTDKDRVQKTIGTLLARQNGLMGMGEEYQGEILYPFTAPFIPGMEPAFGFLDDYLLLGTDAGALKAAIDAVKNRSKNMEKDPFVLQADRGMTPEQNSDFFIRPKEIMPQVLILVDQYNAWLATQDQQRAEFIEMGKKRLEEMKGIRAEILENLKEISEAKSQVDIDAKKMTIDPSETAIQQKQAQMLKVQIVEQQKKIDDAIAGGRDASPLQKEKIVLEQNLIEVNQKLDETQKKQAQLQAYNNQLSEAKNVITARRAEIANIEAKEKVLLRLLDNYRNRQGMPSELRNSLITDLLKPILGSVGNWSALRMRAFFREGAADIFLHLNIQ